MHGARSYREDSHQCDQSEPVLAMLALVITGKIPSHCQVAGVKPGRQECIDLLYVVGLVVVFSRPIAPAPSPCRVGFRRTGNLQSSRQESTIVEQYCWLHSVLEDNMRSPGTGSVRRVYA